MKNNQIYKLPKLLRREHILNEIGIGDSLYYKLIREKRLPIVHIGKRNYVDRDKLLRLLEQGTIDILESDVLSE